VSEGADHMTSAKGHSQASPWRRGLLLTLRDRLEKQTYQVSSDAVAASIIDRAVTRTDDAGR
jgi:hypothetical protein